MYWMKIFQNNWIGISHLIVILVVEVLHEDATGEPLDASLHPHVVLLKILVADVVLCCRLREIYSF